MKTLILGDTHSHKTWKDIIAHEKPDKTIFLGDYFDTFDKSQTPELQIANFEEIISLPNTITLLGNHDAHYLLSKDIAPCSGYNGYIRQMIIDSKKKYKLPIIHIEGDIIFSHAGVSKKWMKIYDIKEIEEINDIPPHYLEFNLFSGYDPYGNTPTQSPTWIRPRALLQCAVEGYTQVVGHTQVKNITSFNTTNYDTLWLCDCLPREYLILNNDDDPIFEVKQWNEQ